MNVRAERFPLIDSVRAIGAIGVLAAHAALVAGIYTSGSSLSDYATQLDVFVTVFFEISAFLLYRPFVKARLAGEPPPSIRVFAWRRLLRIVPGYWLALTLVAIWLGLGGVVHPLWHIPVFYGFGQIYSQSTSTGGLPQAWTLCVEATFYVFLPLWAIAMARLGWRAELAALGGLAALSVGWKIFAVPRVNLSDFGTTAYTAGPWVHPLPNWLDQIALGMALAVVSVRGVPAGVARVFVRAWPWWALAALLYWVMIQTVGHPSLHVGTAKYVARHELHGVIALALLVPAVFSWERGGAIRRLLAWRPLLYVGVISYGIYLWNNPIVFELGGPIARWMRDHLGFGANARLAALSVIGLALAIAVSTVSYFVLERPVLGLKRLVKAAPRRTQPGEALAEPAPAAPTIGRA